MRFLNQNEQTLHLFESIKWLNLISLSRNSGKNFSRRLEMLVEARGYPKTNFGRNKILAKQLEVTPAYVYKLFHGQMGSTLLLPKKIAKTLNTTTDFSIGPD
ncbi:hypothetical protein ACFS07_32945 [Undibacterium arcticum]